MELVGLRYFLNAFVPGYVIITSGYIGTKTSHFHILPPCARPQQQQHALYTCNIYTVTECAHTHRYTNKHSEKLLGWQEPEWPIFSRFSLMSAIKSTRHQYFSALVRQAAIFPFDEAHQRCFVVPGCHSDQKWIREDGKLDRQGAGNLDRW